MVKLRDSILNYSFDHLDKRPHTAEHAHSVNSVVVNKADFRRNKVLSVLRKTEDGVLWLQWLHSTKITNLG